MAFSFNVTAVYTRESSSFTSIYYVTDQWLELYYKKNIDHDCLGHQVDQNYLIGQMSYLF